MALAALGPADMFNRRARLCGRLGLTPLPKLGANGLVGFEVSCRDKRDFRGCELAGVAPIPEGQSAKPLPNAKFSAHFLLPSARRKSAISLRTTDDDDCPSRAAALASAAFIGAAILIFSTTCDCAFPMCLSALS